MVELFVDRGIYNSYVWLNMSTMSDKPIKKPVKKCFVPMCNSSTINTPDKHFIIVPADEDRRKRWCVIAGCSPDVLRLRSHICEDHFNFSEDLENYFQWRHFQKRKVLKEDAYPRFFDCQTKNPQVEIDSTEGIATKETQENHPVNPESSNDNNNQRTFPIDRHVQTETRCANRGTQTKKLEHNHSKSTMSQSSQTDALRISECSFCHRVLNGKIESIPSASKISETSPTDKNAFSPHTSSNGNEIDAWNSSGDTKPDSSNTTSTTHSLKMELLKSKIFQSVTSLIIEDNPILFLGIPEDSFYVTRVLEETSGIIKRDLYLVLKKIRLNNSNAVLAYEFGLSESQVSRIFTSSLPIIASLCQQLITWPPKKFILRNLPLQFRLNFGAVESIIDCFEIHIEHPSDALNQALSWSEYKKNNTAKYLISITPDGLINFISRGYAGRSSDTAIAEDSGYLAQLPRNCAILADRGFKQIESKLQQKGCKLLRPPSVTTGKPSTAQDVRLTRVIAAVRIHVERVIRRLREFKFLASHIAVDHNCLKYLDEIVVIAASLVNLQSRIIV